MAFWGVEVKPKKPYTLKFSDFQAPRLHLSQATLGNRKSDDRIIVRCSVGESPIVYVCSLLPGSVETCPLDLFFDEAVTFSIKGSCSVHLVGYFDGIFDGNESGEDVEDDGYSDEEDEEEDDNCDSLDGFIVSGDDEDDDDDDDDEDGGWFDEDTDIRVPNTGVTIEELLDELEVPEKSIAPLKRIARLSAGNGSVRVEKKEVMNLNVQKQGNAAQFKLESSSEDEDGFHVNRGNKKHVTVDATRVANGTEDQKLENEGNVATARFADDGSDKVENELPPISRKRKHKQAGTETHAKNKSADVQMDTSEPKTTSVEEHEMDIDSKKSSKKKKKKKRKGKDAAEDSSLSPVPQANGVSPTSSKQIEAKREDSEREDSASAVKGKKGTARKHPNGLEIENVKMGKPDGKQATPGRKVGMIYTGRLRSNEKIFDSNVGRKPLFFRLGVGEVIKGWDIGVNGMRVGDKRKLVIPPEMGYGWKGVPGIPPNSWLKFDVELIEVK